MGCIFRITQMLSIVQKDIEIWHNKELVTQSQK